ncbi:MAG: DUF169 domain-containing protein [Dehalococcoidia bacterium]|nr:DUF169 domain-containing protein [Dehalococcoidia bacterium]
MEQRGKWNAIIRKIELLLRLKSFPVGIKFLATEEELKSNKWVRSLEPPMMLCQLISVVRTFDWTVGVTASNISPMCASIVGLLPKPPEIGDGTFRSLVWCKTKEDGKKFEDSVPRIPTGKHRAIIMAPLVYDPFEPDMVLIYANPAQMILLINALQFEGYERMQFYCVGESSCSDAIAQHYLTGKPSLTIPCYGERRYGHAQDDELVIALSPAQVEKIATNLDVLYKRGIRYPISYCGAQLNITTSLPDIYKQFYSPE